MTMLGYARTSTADQNPDRQIDSLLAAGCKPDHIWVDRGVSGTKASRPQLDALLAYARDDNDDVLVCVDLSRMGRSVRNIVVLADDLHQRGIGLRSLTQAIDTTGPSGTLLLSLFAALAEIERNVLVERTLDGLAAARARGRIGGRPTVLPPERLAAARALMAAGQSKAEIARSLGVGRSSLYRALERV